MKLELQGITKTFGPLVANDHIDLVVEPGEIHALLGENGAGKSTLMNVLYGLYDPDEGQILVDDVPVTFAGPGDAMAAGIGMVHQHFMLVPVFTVAENVVLGHEPVRGAGLIDLPEARRRVKEISDQFGFHVDPDAYIEDLPVGVQQRVEIIKALSRHAKVLILDEPTAVLTPQETDELIGIMRQLKESGTSIVFITHKLREVRAVADRITIIRRGKVVGTAEPSTAETELASLMVGRSVDLGVDRSVAEPGEVTVQVRHLTVIDPAGVRQVDDVSFDVARGEIVAIAGVQGNGQTELTEVMLGLQAPVAGSVQLDGVELVGRSVRDVLHAGVGFVPEDRSTDGVIADFSIAENLILDLHRYEPFARGVALRPLAVKENAEKRIAEFDVRTGSIDAYASTLSGGNQQKVVLAREMSRPLRLLIASQPTRGLDVGSIEFVHSRIVEERDNGTPVIIVSTELDEVLALADRILVMYRGRIVGDVPGGTDRDVLGLMMAGVPLDDAVRQAAEHHTALGVADLEAVGDEPPPSPPTATTTTPQEAVSSPTPVPLPDAQVPPPGQTGVAAPAEESDGGRRILHEMLTSSWLVSLLAIVLALIIGGLLIAAADTAVQAAAGYFFSRPGDLLTAAWTAVSEAYAALFAGAVFDPRAEELGRAVRPFTETLTVATPLILAGLGLGIGFRAGLFNIGAQGQIILGGIFAGYIGFTFDLPPVLHLLLCVIGAALGGALWAGIAGVLKARTGAHEVIVTIMLNNIAIYLVAYLLSLNAFQRPGSNNPVSPPIPDSAVYPLLLGSGYRLHAGFLVAIAAAAFTWWLMERSTIGFRFRAVGSNPNAARTAGISVNATYVWVMLTAGAFAGLAGSAQVLGTERVLTAGVAASYGFDAITVALLGRSKPLGTVLAGILFGALRAGGVVMQARTGTPIDIVLVVQSLIVLFIAAPPLVRAVFRLPSPDTPRAPKPVVPVAAKEVSA